MISERSRGYVLGAIAAASYGLNPLFALPLYGAGLGVDSVLFYRYVLAVVMLGALMLFRRQSFALRRRDVLPLAAMGVLFSVSSLLLFESYNLMDAGIASTILFVYPVMVAVIMAVGFRERVTAATVVSIALACGGISLLYKGGNGATLNLAGVVLVFLSALSYAVWIVAVNRSSLKDPLFYIRLFGHVLGHANWEHFLNNMLLLLVVGPPMEEKYGSIPLLKGILFTALVTGVLQCILFPHTGLLGASGIVFMLIMLSSLAGFSGGIPVTMLLVAALYFGQQVYDIIFVHDNVANFMHIVGGLCGTAFGYYCALHRRPARSRR